MQPHRYQQQLQQPVSILTKKIATKNPYFNNNNNSNEENINIDQTDLDYGMHRQYPQHHNQPHYNHKQPISILKRNDESSDKMYPISRPNCNQQFSQTNKISSIPIAKANRRFVQNPYASINDSKLMISDQCDYSSNPKISMMMNHTLNQTGTRKRVQFATTPTLASASSEGDLSKSNSTRIMINQQERKASIHSHSHSHKHRSNHQSGHRRSSSTSNFNTSTLSCRSHNPRMNRSDKGRSSFRQFSNRSLNTGDVNHQIYSDHSDYYDPSEPCTCECEENTCSTCSSNTTSSTTSTDSDSDMDDFGCDPLDNYYKFQYNNYARAAQFDQRSVGRMGVGQQSSSSIANQQMNSLSRRYNSGVKISYVDSLPLARTNPAPLNKKAGDAFKENKGKSDKNGVKGEKKKFKFKKDNCVVS